MTFLYLHRQKCQDANDEEVGRGQDAESRKQGPHCMKHFFLLHTVLAAAAKLAKKSSHDST